MISPMLASNARESRIVYPIDVQPKLDGFRCIAQREAGKVVLRSRRGRILYIKHISTALATWLPPGMVLDGELYTPGVSFQGIQSLAANDAGRALSLWVFDLVEAGTWAQRRKRLDALTETPRHVHIVDTETVANEADMWACYERHTLDGGEGIILRDPSAPYIEGRSTGLLKLKAFDDAEFRVALVESGKGKAAGQAIFTCLASNGKPFRVVCRGSDADRSGWYENRAAMVGRRLTVRHFGLTDGGIPRSPIGAGFRSDADMPKAAPKGMAGVARLMQAGGTSLRKWAAMAGVDRQTLRRAIDNPDAVAFGTIKAIAQAAGVPVGAL